MSSTSNQFIPTHSDIQQKWISNDCIEFYIIDQTNKEIISKVKISSHFIRIGSSVISIGGLGDLETNITYRRKGYGRRLMETAIEYMKYKKFALSLLFGIGNFYEKFQYISIMDDWSRILMDIKWMQQAKYPKIKEKQDEISMKTLEKSHLSSILSIYNEYNALRTGTAIRTIETLTNIWKNFLEIPSINISQEIIISSTSISISESFQFPESAVITFHKQHEIIGYIEYCIYSRGRYNLYSGEASLLIKDFAITSSNENLIPKTLKLIQLIAQNHSLKQIECALPMDTTFAIYARRIIGTRYVLNYPRNAEVMMQIIDIHQLMKQLLPEWKQKWTHLSKEKQWIGIIQFKLISNNLTFYIETTSTDLQLLSDDQINQTHQIMTCEIPLQKFNLLIMGTTTINALIMDDDVKIPSELLNCFHAFFLLSNTHVYLNDKF